MCDLSRSDIHTLLAIVGDDAAGEAYYDPELFGFAARVGQYNVSVQADYRPAPRKELITIGTRITKALAGK